MEEYEEEILLCALTFIGLGISFITLDFWSVNTERKWCPSADDAKAYWDSEEERTANNPGQLRLAKWRRRNYEQLMRHGLAKWGLFVVGLGLLLLILWFVFIR